MKTIPSYDPKFFRVAEPAEPRFSREDLNTIVPINQKMVYSFEEVLARVTDNSEHLEFRPEYGPEVYTGLVKMDGFLLGSNREQARHASTRVSGICSLSGYRRKALQAGPHQDE